jgi:hypothetical protein
LAREANNPYNVLSSYSVEEEESKSPEQDQPRSEEGRQQLNIDDTPSSRETDYLANVRSVGPSRSVPPPALGQPISFIPYRLGREDAIAPVTKPRRDSPEVQNSQARDDEIAALQANQAALASRMDKVQMAVDIANTESNAKFLAIERRLDATDKKIDDKFLSLEATMQLILSRLPLPAANSNSESDEDLIRTRKRSDSSLPSNVSTPKGPELPAQPIRNERPKMRDTTDILHVSIGGIPGLYEAVVDHEAGACYIQHSLPLAQYIQSHSEIVYRTLEDNFPVYILNVVIRTRCLWKEQQRLKVVVGDYHDPPSVLVFAPQALIEDIESSANSTVSSAFTSAGIRPCGNYKSRFGG